MRIRILLFSSLTFKIPAKNNLFNKFFCLLLSTSFLKIKSLKEVACGSDGSGSGFGSATLLSWALYVLSATPLFPSVSPAWILPKFQDLIFSPTEFREATITLWYGTLYIPVFGKRLFSPLYFRFKCIL
jgi:hypothetical protein